MRMIANGTIAVLDPNLDQGISHFAARDSSLSAHDPRIQTQFCCWIPEGGTVVDAGAFIGDHTLPYAEKVGRAGKVWAFEPDPAALNCLVFNTQAYPQVQVVTAALGEREEMVRLQRHPRDGAATMIQPSDDGGIPVVPLDKFHFDRLDFVKFDCEGYELKALRGAAQTLRQHHPIVITESGVQLARYGDSHAELLAYMAALGYDSGIRLMPQHVGTDVFDMVFQPTAVM